MCDAKRRAKNNFYEGLYWLKLKPSKIIMKKKLTRIKGNHRNDSSKSPLTHKPIVREALTSKKKAIKMLPVYKKGRITPNREIATKDMQKGISAYQALGCTLDASGNITPSLIITTVEVKKKRLNSVRESEA